MPRVVLEIFEKFMEEKFETPVVLTNSGTSALIATLWSMGLEGHDEVITTPFSFMATTNAILIAGATPIFADVDERGLMRPDSVRDRISRRTKAILPVHLFGESCHIEEMVDIADEYDVALVEDAAQAFGATHERKLLGTWGDAGCFSFYKTKNFSTFEGGMISVPQRSRLNHEAIRAIVDQGQTSKYVHEYVGFNFRMSELSALVGLERAKLHWDGTVSELGKYGFEDGHYPTLIYSQPAFKKTGIAHTRCPGAESLAAKVRGE